MRYSSTYDDTFVNRVDVIDVAYEEFVQDVLDFQYNPKSSSPTLVTDASVSESDSSKEPIVKSSSPTLTPFGESDFFLEEIEDFLNDDSIPTGTENSVYDPEGDILFLEKLLNEDPFQLLLMDLKLAEESKAKSSIEEPPELELKELPSYLEYAFLEDSKKLPVIIAKNLKDVEREALINVLKFHKRAIAWKISDIKGIDPRVNPKIHDVIKKEVIKLLNAGMIYPIPDNPWVSPIHCVPKKGGMTVVANENNELIPTRLVTSWRVCIDYRKLNDDTRKDHFPLPFMDQMLERLAGNEFCCFLDGFSGYFQIPIAPQDHEKTTFTCPYETFVYQRMPFGLCNAPATFQRCMMSIFHDMIEKTMEVFMDDFSVFGDREGIVFGHKISKSGIKVDRAKTNDSSLKKETPFVFSKECVDAFDTLKKKLTEAPILVVPDWNLPFELMCDASDYVIGVVLGQHKSKHFHPIHYASKTMTKAQIHYTTTEKKMLAVVYAFEKFRPYLVLSKSIVYTDHSALKYLLNKQDEKPRYTDARASLLRWAVAATRFIPGARAPLFLIYQPQQRINPVRIELTDGKANTRVLSKYPSFDEFHGLIEKGTSQKAGKDNLFSIKLHHGGKFTPSPKRRYVGGKLNYVDKIDMDPFNVYELHMFVKDLGPLSCDADVVSLIKLVENCKEVEVFVEYWLTSVDHQFLSPVKYNVKIEEIEEIYDDVLLNAHVVRSSKTLALCWINEADVRESSLDKNANVHEEQQIISVNDYLMDDRYELDIDENLNLEDYTVYVHENVDENMNVNADDENVNANDENVNADDGYDSVEDEQDHVDDEEGRGNVREDFIMDEEHVVDEVEVNMKDEALEVLDFDSFDSDIGDDTESIRRRKLRKLRKTGGQSCVQEHMQKQFQVGVSKTKAFRAKVEANPNTTVKIDVYRAHNLHENVRRSKRIYVCLGALKDGFRAFGRQLLRLDGAFMKGNYPGQMLTAMSVDANNGIYFVAYGIVESESKESWTWFLSCLGDDLDLEANSSFTFITDRQKGQLPALKDLFLAAEHKYCVSRIHDNMNLISKDKNVAASAKKTPTRQSQRQKSA
nr:retrovirus-related Pol polyprotein [Tanacetum cinerariifolium]